jgi:hypothetical protein
VSRTKEAEDKGGESDVGRLEGVAESVETKSLVPLQSMIEELGRSVATVMQGANASRQLETTSAQSGPIPMPGQQQHQDIPGNRGAKTTSTGSSQYLTDWGGMKMTEVNRLFKDNLSIVSVKKAGDAKFAAARAC